MNSLKKVLLFLGAISTFLNLYGWEYRISHTYSTTLLNIIELENHDYLISYFDQPYIGGINYCYLLRISEDGKFISQLDASTLFPDSQVFITYLNQVNGEVILHGTVGSNLLGYSSAVMRLDQHLNPLWDTTYTGVIPFHVRSSAKTTATKTTFAIKHGSYFGESGFVVMDNSYQIDTIIKLPLANPPDGITWLSEEQTCYGVISDNIQVYDQNNLNLLKSRNLNGSFQNTSLPMPDTSMIISGYLRHARNSFPPIIADGDMCLYRVDSTLDVLDSMVIDLPMDQSSAERQSLIRINNEIYFGGQDNFDFSLDHPRTAVESRPFLLYKLNKDLDVIWQKKYVENSACVLYEVFKTTDNHILLIGSCFNYEEDSNRREVDLRIIKLDTNGNFVGLEENLAIADYKIKVFPNPANSHLFIELPENERWKKASIRDAFGRKVLDFSAESSITPLNIESLTKGLYFIQIESATSIFSCRFLKE